MKHVEPEASMPERLVHSETDAHWLDPAVTGNPSRIGVLLEVPSRAAEVLANEAALHVIAQRLTDLSALLGELVVESRDFR